MKPLKLLIGLVLLTSMALASQLQKSPSFSYGFIENKGQIIDQNNNLNSEVKYLFNGNGFNVQLKSNSFSYDTYKIEIDDYKDTETKQNDLDKNVSYKFHRIDILLLNSNKNVSIIPLESYQDYINYYTTGTNEAGVMEVKHFKKIIYKNIYNSIDIEFLIDDSKDKRGFKYNFIIHPGGNIDDIKLKFEGANSLEEIEETVKIETRNGFISESIPYSYQLDKDNKQVSITGGFKHMYENVFGINISKFDRSSTLIIDPFPWASYYGGPSDDYTNDLKIDSVGNIYAIGSTLSSTSIATSGSFKNTFSGGTGNDAFIVKFNSQGTRLWATYFGNSDDDYGQGISIDKAGSIIICGHTYSSNGISTTGANQSAFGGYVDVYIAKFTPSGSRIWSTYFGGTAVDYIYGITNDNSNNILITGMTGSSNGISTIGAHQTSRGSANSGDAFLAKYNTNGLLIYSTYYGGSGEEYGIDLAVDSSNNIYLVGSTYSSNNISTINSQQSTYGGNNDGYLVKFNSSGTRLWGTYFGGTNEDRINDIAMDISGNIWLAGYSLSTNFSTTGAFQSSISETTNGDAMLIKFNSNGSLLYATYYGESGYETANDIIIDGNGNPIISGLTNSTNGLSTIGAYQTNYGGGTHDAFITKFNTSGLRIWSTYFGGNNRDIALGLAKDNNNNVYICGNTVSANAISTIGAFQTLFSGTASGVNGDGFISIFSGNGVLPVQLTKFTAKLIENDCLTEWQTASETNNKEFIIERSPNNYDWSAIGSVKGNGNSSSKNRYNFVDLNTPKNTVIYYRLKQVDFNGQYSYSHVEIITPIELTTNTISVFPNPTTDLLNITGANTRIEIYNTLGIKLFDLEGDSVIDISGLDNGIYFVVSGSQKTKFIKQ
jgi:hypothetical protein